MVHLEIIGYPLLICAAVEFLLGISLLRDNPRNSSVNRSVGAFSIFTASFTLITGLMYVLASFGRDITPLARANWIGWLKFSGEVGVGQADLSKIDVRGNAKVAAVQRKYRMHADIERELSKE